MKRHAFDRYERKHNPEKLTHRHLPLLSHWFLSAWWTYMHLFMPWMIHYLTDKYEQKKNPWRHVVVDTVYAATTLTLLFVNIGIGVWFYLFFTPADLDVRILTKTQVVSGRPFDIVVTYANPYRNISDAKVRVELPEGFVAATASNENIAEYDLGRVQKGDVSSLPITGVIFGDVGKQYTIRVITSYEYLGKWQQEVTIYHFSVQDSSLELSVDIEDTVVYGRPTEAVIRYVNRSTVARKNADLFFELPAHFVVTSAISDTQNIFYANTAPQIRIARIPAEEKGEIRLHGYFSYARAEEHRLNGDQETEIGVSVKAAIDSPLARTEQQFAQPAVHGTTHVVNPRVQLVSSAPNAIHFGDQLRITQEVRNIGDTPVTRVQLRMTTEGIALSPEQAAVSISIAGTLLKREAVRGSAQSFALPQIDSIPAGSTAVITLNIPTRKIEDQQVVATTSITGTVYAPEIDSTIPLERKTTSTKFHSRVDLFVTPIYFSPDGEQLGYGPYPTQPWEETSFRTLLGLQNFNNPLSDVMVTATLSPQATWTDFFSVSAGTSMQYNKNTRTITWRMSSLTPQSQRYGGQFELLFMPNHLQRGLTPNLINSLRLSAQDAFTGERFVIEKGQIAIPKTAVVQ